MLPRSGGRPLLAVVADGVGGEAGGELASAAAVDTVVARWSEWRAADAPSEDDVERRLRRAGGSADGAVRALADVDPRLARAATTLTAVAVLGGVAGVRAIVLHAGDSRAYSIDARGSLTRLTTDHAERNVVSRFLGQSGGCAFDVGSAALERDGSLLLCTDGVTNVLPDDELGGVLWPSAGRGADAAVMALLAAVARRAGADDATVVFVTPAAARDPYGLRRAESPSAAATALRAARRPLLITGVGVGVIAAVGAAVATAARRLGRPAGASAYYVSQRYVDDWARADYDAMYGALSLRAQREMDLEAFRRRHEAIAAELTQTAAERRLAADAGGSGSAIQLPVDVIYRTARFGELHRRVLLPLLLEDHSWVVDWTPAVILPELTDGRLVRAVSDAAPRGSVLDGASRPLATTSGTGARAYPQGDLAGPIVGYVGQISQDELNVLAPRGYLPGDSLGRAGMEAAAEATLAGQRGGRLTVIQPNGDAVETLATVPPRAGESLVLTLDVEMQREVERALGDRTGSAVVIDPRSGAIRALASAPRYDPNVFVRGGDTGAVLDNPAQPLIARPLQGQYPPGSTFKVITMAAALESGVFTPASEFICTGRWTGLPGLTFDCWLRTGHGRQDLVSGLTHSCNSVFYEIGKRLDEVDPDLLTSVAARAGVGVALGVAPEIEPSGVAPSPAWKQRVLRDGWARGDAVNMAIGQGQLLVTPLQLASVYTAIASAGKGPGLKLRGRSLLPGGSVERQLPAAPPRVQWSDATFEAIRAGLRGVVGTPDGTAAFVFQGSPLAGIVAGKTGTAETGAGRQTHAWFACYAPHDAPKAVVLVMLEHAGEGSVVAAPIARRILETVLDRL